MTSSIRTTPPEPLAAIPFHLPQAFQQTLGNGLKVVVFEDNRLPLVSLRLAFLAGDAQDPADSVGLTSAVMSLLTEGTENYSSRELAETIERLGASVSASSSDDFSIIAASALSMYTDEVLRLLSEVVFRPTFPESELDLYRRNSIENLKFQRSQPNFLANEQIARLIYGEHPYSRVAPAAADIEKLARNGLVEHKNRLMVPNNAVLMVIGDVHLEELMSEVEDHFGHWQPAEAELPEFQLPLAPTSRKMIIVDRPGSAQSNIVLANPAFPRNDPDYFAAAVMNQILGAGASSRIFMNLREEKGYTYGAYTRIDSKRWAGDFEATAEVRTAVTGDALKEFFYELERIRNEKVQNQELSDAKSFLTGVFPIRAETQEGLANLIVNQQLYGLPDDYLQTYREHISAITIEDVELVARKHVQPDSIAIVIVGDAQAVIPQVEDFSDSIEIKDTDGRVKDRKLYTQSPPDGHADISGSWHLKLDFMGQQVPITLTVKQAGEVVTGSLSTVLGDGEIKDGRVSGSKFTATAVTEMQGQSVDFVINGAANGDRLEGTISSAAVPEPLSFSGNREPS